MSQSGRFFSTSHLACQRSWTGSLTPTKRALLALALGGFGIGTGEFVTLGLLPNVAASLHISIPQAGHLVSAYALGVVVGAPLLTAAAVRLPRKGLLITVAIMMAVLNVASAAMPGYRTLLLMRFLTGLPHGAYFGVASVVAGNLVERRRRSTAMAIVFAGLTVANVIGVPMTTLIGQHSSWRVCHASPTRSAHGSVAWSSPPVSAMARPTSSPPSAERDQELAERSATQRSMRKRAIETLPGS